MPAAFSLHGEYTCFHTASLSYSISLADRCFGGSSLYLEESALYTTVFAGVSIPQNPTNNSSKKSRTQTKQRVECAGYLSALKAVSHVTKTVSTLNGKRFIFYSFPPLSGDSFAFSHKVLTWGLPFIFDLFDFSSILCIYCPKWRNASL